MTRDADAHNERYGPAHRRERARWRPVVQAGQARCAALVCLEPDRAIAPDAEWDLDHHDTGVGYRGPAHARCNRSAGGATTAARADPRSGLLVRRWGDPAEVYRVERPTSRRVPPS
ncbi:hypothetical protein [Geodermatophilus sp. URMC 62]|uniref:hypothetical protein n=1 Tax=Geodermatophilus sp. URMC 62 TaxID=3423414 RepID=UPI00406BE856